MNEGAFSWIPLYRELAEALLAWRQKQQDLIGILKIAQSKGHLVGNLEDENEMGQPFPLTVMDPFSFFGTFNRKVGDNSRIGILSVIKEQFGLKASLPSDFKGIPVMNPQMAQFFSFARSREEHAIDTLWDFAEMVVRKRPEEVSSDLFARCLEIRQVGTANLTMGMFWMRPDTYFGVDSLTRKFLKSRKIEVDVVDWTSYLKLRTEIASQLPDITWSELSYQAYNAKGSAKHFWLFQANPERYDLIGALREGVHKTWQARQHKDDIHIGDHVVMWLAGKDSGVYALATVETGTGADIRGTPREKILENLR